MQLKNTFVVPVPVDQAWRVLLDVEQIAPCMPGASVDHVDGDDITGRVKVKLGPIAVGYEGTISFVERDETRHRAVLSAAAREARGGGTARATIAASLEDGGGQTTVNVVTDLAITGKPAQFGRGVMADVSEHIINQFASNLANELQSGRIRTGSVEPTESGEGATTGNERAHPTAAAVPGASADLGPRASLPAPDSINVVSLLKAPARRLAPPLGAGLVIGWLLGRLGRRSSHRGNFPRESCRSVGFYVYR
jgi:carbon monoxide dehydrogenase subunit G